MSDVVIRAEGLGKKYIIGHQAQREANATLRDSIARSVRNWGRSARDMFAGNALVAGDETEEFWALKDINFEIKRGDVVGMVGRNGAGKSTLLKVLSRITEPTTGRVAIDGRVASLLEVGTGFHPELSGRENVYLNGAILGMSREEIRRKFDEIVDFAGVERFLDTPVKRYSSGMYVRLAFAVAAHLEPEILIVDEVLAVGDAEFQKKCLGKMKDVAGQGRTVLFVSHQLAAVGNLCSRAIILQSGRIIKDAEPAQVIREYTSSFANKQRRVISSGRRNPVNLISAKFGKSDSSTKNVFDSNEEIPIAFEVSVRENIEPFRVGFRINSSESGVILTTSDTDSSSFTRREVGLYSQLCVIPANLLSPGEYTVSIAADWPMKEILFNEIDVLCFNVTPLGAAGSEFPDSRLGVIRPVLRWERAVCIPNSQVTVAAELDNGETAL